VTCITLEVLFSNQMNNVAVEFDFVDFADYFDYFDVVAAVIVNTRIEQ
jgi:hypothetical protein